LTEKQKHLLFLSSSVGRERDMSARKGERSNIRSRKDEHLDVRLQTGELAQIQAAADHVFLKPAQWVRQLVLHEIRELAKERQGQAGED
jgi:hypothetical protein